MRPTRVRAIRALEWVDPLSVAMGLSDRDGALCLLSDPTIPGARAFIAADPDQVRIDDISDDLFSPLRDDEAWGEGVVGLAAYDAGARVATGPRKAIWPDLMLARYPAMLVFDHETKTLQAVGWGHDAAAAEAACGTAEAWLAPSRQADAWRPELPSPPAATMTAEAPDQTYLDAVTEVVARIGAGELFQANIARAWSGVLHPDADPFAVFLRLALKAEAPYGAFWRLGDRALVSNSPELFVALERATGRVETRPIKGTARRDEDPTADVAAALVLQASAKDRAENLMIVDLMRNDLGRVCRPGSVKVETLFAIESHPVVHHLVSTVTGDLAAGQGVGDLLTATFPPGSITGAPKHQAMKVIADLEAPRGAWCGSLFVLEHNADLTASVLIRTAAFEQVEGRWRYRTLAGAGIVADSDPLKELDETDAKISALRNALIGQAD